MIFTPEPDADGQLSWGCGSWSGRRIRGRLPDVQAGFFEELASGRLPDVLAPLDVAARDAPLAEVAAGGAPAQQDAAGIIQKDNGDAHRRVAEVDEPA